MDIALNGQRTRCPQPVQQAFEIASGMADMVGRDEQGNDDGQGRIPSGYGGMDAGGGQQETVAGSSHQRNPE